MKELTVKASLANIPVVTEFIDGLLEALDCPMKAQMQIDVAIDELFSNIARYAYPGSQGEATVGFVFDEAERVCSIVFTDSGLPFNPLEQQEPDVSLPADERQIGGLGIFLVRKTMNSIEYRRENGRNILTIRKKI